MAKKKRPRAPRTPWWITLLVSPIWLLVIIFLLFGLPYKFIVWLFHAMCMMFKIFWFRRIRGVSCLIIYSDSAQWKPYFENEVIPAFGKRVRVINLSTFDRAKRTKQNIDWYVYGHCCTFGGTRNRFPMVIRFSWIGTWSTVRFYDAFMQSKKGKNQQLEKAKTTVERWAQSA